MAAAVVHLAAQLLDLSLNLEKRLFAVGNLAFEIDLRLFEEDGLHGLGDHQEQDDGAEAAADHVKKRDAELLDASAIAGFHGQSRDGERNAPPVMRARFQYAAGAIGSPSMGNMITLMGTCFGSALIASANSLRRSPPEMVARRGSRDPWVGNESMIR